MSESDGSASGTVDSVDCLSPLSVIAGVEGAGVVSIAVSTKNKLRDSFPATDANLFGSAPWQREAQQSSSVAKCAPKLGARLIPVPDQTRLRSFELCCPVKNP